MGNTAAASAGRSVVIKRQTEDVKGEVGWIRKLL